MSQPPPHAMNTLQQPNARASASGRLPMPTAVLVNGLLYLLVASLTLSLPYPGTALATIWYANAVAICLLLARRKREWPVHLAMFGLADFLAGYLLGNAPFAALLYVPGNLIETLSGAALLTQFSTPRTSVTRVDGLLRALLLGALVPAALGASATALIFHQWLHSPIASSWSNWFERSAIGGVAFLPLGLLCLARGRRALSALFHQPYSLAAIAVALSVTFWAPTHLLQPYVYITAALVVVALVGRFPAASTANLLCAVLASLQVGGNTTFLPRELQDVLIYMPLVLTLLPPVLLASALERMMLSAEELRHSERHFRRLYQNAPTMMHSVDLQGRIINVNTCWLDHFGYRESDVLGRSPTDFMTPDSRHYTQETLIPIFRLRGAIRDARLTMLTRDGREVNVEVSAIWERDDDGRPARQLAVIKDVTEQHRLATELAAEKERAEVTLHSIGDGVISTDNLDQITYLNPVAETLLGWSLAEAQGRPFEQVVHVYDRQSGTRLPDLLRRSHQSTAPHTPLKALVLRSRDGAEYGIRENVSPILSQDGALMGTVMVVQDVTEANQLAEKMFHLAHHDSLTGLPNRILYQDRLLHACQLGQRNQRQFAVMFLDLDHFKNVNDSLGHAFGDELLQLVATRLTDILRSSDTICRLGGDEFVMLLEDISCGETASELARKVINEVTQPYTLRDTELIVTASVGIALFPSDGEDPSTLMKHADAAMYRAKRDGRNGFHLFSRSADDAAIARLSLENDLRRGIAQKEFVLHYQPVVDASTRRVKSLEALVRWQTDTFGPLRPDLFIPVAEESGLIVPLGRLLLESACQQLQAWQGSALDAIRVAVNVSTVQLRAADFAAMLEEILTQYGIPGDKLILEITESTLMTQSGEMLATLQRVKRLGVGLSIDDFGTGYSSLSYLKRFPVDTVKIDRSFVRDLEHDPSDLELIKAILAMANALKLQVVAEGVENEAQASKLAALNCQALQGYLFARPDTADNIAALVTEQNQQTPRDWII